MCGERLAHSERTLQGVGLLFTTLCMGGESLSPTDFSGKVWLTLHFERMKRKYFPQIGDRAEVELRRRQLARLAPYRARHWRAPQLLRDSCDFTSLQGGQFLLSAQSLLTSEVVI